MKMIPNQYQMQAEHLFSKLNRSGACYSR